MGRDRLRGESAFARALPFLVMDDVERAFLTNRLGEVRARLG